jgi:hypothetical protein
VRSRANIALQLTSGASVAALPLAPAAECQYRQADEDRAALDRASATDLAAVPVFIEGDAPANASVVVLPLISASQRPWTDRVLVTAAAQHAVQPTAWHVIMSAAAADA